MGISMKIQKSIFLISYIIYLFCAVVYVMISNEGAKIDTLIFSVTVASTFFSISDLIYTKIEINKREWDEIVALYFLSKYAEEFYMEKAWEENERQSEKQYSFPQLTNHEICHEMFWNAFRGRSKMYI